MSDTSTLLETLVAALRPVIAETVNAAVAEAVKRAPSVEPVDGTCESVVGRTANVRIPNTAMLIPTTALSTAIVPGSAVLVFFYGNGRAYCNGPLAAP